MDARLWKVNQVARAVQEASSVPFMRIRDKNEKRKQKQKLWPINRVKFKDSVVLSDAGGHQQDESLCKSMNHYMKRVRERLMKGEREGGKGALVFVFHSVYTWKGCSCLFTQTSNMLTIMFLCQSFSLFCAFSLLQNACFLILDIGCYIYTRFWIYLSLQTQAPFIFLWKLQRTLNRNNFLFIFMEFFRCFRLVKSTIFKHVQS